MQTPQPQSTKNSLEVPHYETENIKRMKEISSVEGRKMFFK